MIISQVGGSNPPLDPEAKKPVIRGFKTPTGNFIFVITFDE